MVIFAAQVPFDYAGSLYAGIPFGAEIRDLSQEPFGNEAGREQERLRENVFFAHHWVDYSDGQKGLTLVAAEGKRGFHFDPQTRTLAHILLMTIVPHANNEFATLFSNRYFRGTGRHSFEYSLIPHGGGIGKRQAACCGRRNVSTRYAGSMCIRGRGPTYRCGRVFLR